MTQGKGTVVLGAILLVAVMVLSSLAVLSTAFALPSSREAPTISTNVAPSGTGTAAAAALTTATAGASEAALAAHYAAIEANLESRGVKANLIHLPSALQAGYINGELTPGPEYAVDTEAGVSQGYTAPPAPAGVAYYGQSGSDSSKVVTSVDTSSLAGTLNVQNLSTLYLDSDAPDEWGAQLNAVLVNLSLEGVTEKSSDPFDIWAQNVVSYEGSTSTLSLVDNTWNFSSTATTFPSSGTGTVVANDTSDVDYGGELYIGTGPTFYAPAPFTIALYLNTSLQNPFICTSDSSVYFSSTCSNPVTGTAAYVGDQTLFYNYTFSDVVTGQKVSGTYDWYTFHTGAGSVFDPSNTRVAGFEADGYVDNILGLTNDFEFDFGIGAYDGANQNVFSANGTATLDYIADCTKPTKTVASTCTPSSSHTEVSVPAALNFGSETGEDTVGLEVAYSGTTALFSAGPLNLHALWGYSSQAGVAAGATKVNNGLAVSGSPLTLTAQPYIFVFFEDTSITTPTDNYAWAPDVPAWYLMPGTYKWEAMLADYTEQTGTLTVAGTTVTLTGTLPYATSNGVYTPLWATDNAQLAGISSSGSGTVSSPYVLFNNADSSTGGELNAAFLTDAYDDYDFPSFAGVLLWGTHAYVNVHSEVTFLVGAFAVKSGKTTTDYDTYLQQELYDTSHVTVSNSAGIYGWSAMESLVGAYPASQNTLPQGELMVWDSTSDLVYDNDFFGTATASTVDFTENTELVLFGGTGNVVWGNTFSDPSGVTKASPGTYAGIAEAENGDLIYNNNFQVDNPAPLMPWNLYTEEGPVTYQDTWNISEEAATDVATFNGFSLTGSIVGSGQPFQGGNEWWDYGNLLNGASTTPFRNVVSYTDYKDVFPPGYAEEQAGLAVGGDYHPLLGFTLTFTESGLPSGTSWGVTILGVSVSSTTTTASYAGVPNGAYAYTITGAAGYRTTYTGTATVDGAALNVPVAFSRTTYSLGFTETGLPGGTSWAVTIAEVEVSSTTGSLAFNEPNGTYSYTVTTAGGYHATPSTGSVTINGAGSTVPVAFAQVTYSVTFDEFGLSGSTSWSVTLDGDTETTSGSSLAFAEPNGTFGYNVVPIAGYVPNAYSGSVVVNAASTSVDVTFTQVTYSVVFDESGLPSGQTFQVTVGGASQQVTTDGGTDGLSFTEPNGTYSYAISNVVGFSQSTLPATGSVVVDGASVAEPTLVYSALTYCVTFSETGLASGTLWSVTFNGVTKSSTHASIAFYEPNGTWAFSVAPVAGYGESPASGSITVAGAAVPVPVTFAVTTYAVTFSESGLPDGATFAVALNGAPESVTTDGGTDSVVFSVANGTYDYAISGVSGWYQSSLPYDGQLTVDGRAVTEPTAVFGPVTYSVTIEEGTLPASLTFAATLGGVPASTTTDGGLDALGWSGLANGTYSYAIAGISGWHQASLAYSGDLTVNGADLTLTLVYVQVTYDVAFTETGLPSGTTWSVTVGVDTQSASGSTISFSEPNGTYGYYVPDVADYGADPALGTAVVDGAGVAVPVVFTQGVFSVTFEETGLPVDTTWSVNVGGVSYFTSTADTIVVMLTDGMYSYTVGAVPGYTATPSSGSVTVNGADLTVGLDYRPVSYAVTFIETGLKSTKTWSVAFDGTLETAAAGVAIFFSAVAGTYTYLVASDAAYRVSNIAPEGSLAVTGTTVQPVTFVPGATYTLAFHEVGLKPGTSWCVTVGSAVCSTTSTVDLKHLTPGTYAYSVGSIGSFTTSVKLAKLTLPASGTVAVVRAVSLKVEFTLPVKFTESGLPSGTAWKVSAGGQSGTSITDAITLYLVNGTYTFHVAHVAGFHATPATGSVTVAGSAVGVSVTFAPVSHHAPANGPDLPLPDSAVPSARATQVARAL